MNVACDRRGCSTPAAVATRAASGDIDEHLCESHAWEMVRARAATLSRIVYLGTKRPFVAVSVAKAGAA